MNFSFPIKLDKENCERKLLSIKRLLAFPRRIIARIITYSLLTKNGVIIVYSDPKRSKVINLIRKIKSENEILMGNHEAYQIFMAVRRTEKIKGDISEAGIYMGGSAKLISEAKGNKTLHLFDTFEGLPDLCPKDNPRQFHKGQYPSSLKNVKDYLKKYQDVHFYKGIFPLTTEPIKNKRFSFVHLDLDLHEYTLEGLKFFYPRMNKGGIIMLHDYMSSLGVTRAVDEFFKDKPEPIIETSDSQCLIVKV